MAGAYPIEFRFIKPEPTNPDEDEIIRITPFMVGNKRQFMWRYLADNKRASTQVCIIEDEFFLNEKLRHMAELMSWDSDPYEQVQLLLPTSPSVLFRCSDFPDAIEKVIDAIKVALRHWPVKMDTVEAASRNAQEPGREKLETLVQKLLHGILADGQLDECDLTLKDLAAVSRAFVTALERIYSARPGFQAAQRAGETAAPYLSAVRDDERRSAGS
jgi:hypothetical protein